MLLPLHAPLHSLEEKKGKKKKVSFSPQTNLTTIDPEVWIAAFQQEEASYLSALDVLKYIYFALTFAIILGLPVPTFNTFLDLLSETKGIWTTVTVYFSSAWSSLLWWHPSPSCHRLVHTSCWALGGLVACSSCSHQF